MIGPFPDLMTSGLMSLLAQFLSHLCLGHRGHFQKYAEVRNIAVKNSVISQEAHALICFRKK